MHETISTGGSAPAFRLHGHPLEHNVARAATAEAVGTVLSVVTLSVLITLLPRL